MRILIYFFLLAQLLFAIEKTTQEASVFDQVNSQKPVQVERTPQSQSFYQEAFVDFETASKSLYVNYIYFPKRVYKGQRFEISIKSLITNKNFDRIETRFIEGKEFEVLNPTSSWKKVDENNYSNRYFFKANNQSMVLPTFQVILYKDGLVKESAYLKPEELNFSEIAKGDERFTQVIAKSLKINTHKTKQYNNNELITILDMTAVESNLEDFKINGFEEQGISSLEEEYPVSKMLYYLVVPVHTKVIDFKYYNLEMQRLESIKIPIILEEGLVSTQTDLNPNKSNLLFYKRVAAASLAVLFLAIFIWKRRMVFLIAGLLFVIIFILFAMPNKVSYLKNNASVYILPTKNSTIFLKTDKTIRVEIVNQKDDFVKIMFDQNGKSIIGWVKENKVVKN